MEKIEYRVRPVTRYFVTRYSESEDGRSGDCREMGEYNNEEVAQAVGYALCKAEHEKLGWPVCDERIQYPRPIMNEGIDPRTLIIPDGPNTGAPIGGSFGTRFP